MNDLGFYLREGWKHIISLDALDHQLFIIVLCVMYTARDWRKLLILVTAFTLGHSLTLALSTFDLLSIDTAWVEFLIPVTIVMTGLYNILQFKKRSANNQSIHFQYTMAFIFGLVHGLGFANTIRMMLASDQNFASALFGFNVGLELGQIVVVAIYLAISEFLFKSLHIKRQYWVISISLLVVAIAGWFTMTRLPF